MRKTILRRKEFSSEIVSPISPGFRHKNRKPIRLNFFTRPINEARHALCYPLYLLAISYLVKKIMRV